MYNEVIVFNTTLSNIQRQTVEGYLAWKWGLESNLPVGHSYKLYNSIVTTPGWNKVISGSRILGNVPYTNTLLSTSIPSVSGGTAMYEVGPITTSNFSKLLITANLSLVTSATHYIQLTVGRFKNSGANSSESTNIPSNTDGIPLPYNTGSVYVMATTTTSANDSASLCGTATDIPGPGTFYYRIWAWSTPSISSNNTLTANLNIVQM
jgi:hypothetical protein